jgi:predicted Zn-dependent peptidase
LATSSFDTSVMICDWSDVSGLDSKDLTFVLSMWSNGINAPLYQEIREKRGLVYGLGMFTKSYSKDNTIALFNCNCSPDNVEVVRSVFRDTIKDVEQYITKERFDIILEQTKCQLEQKEALNYSNISKFVSYDWEYVDLEYLESLQFETILETAKTLSNTFLTNYKEADYGKTCRV